MSDRPFSKLLINESPLQVLPSLAVKVGVNGAMFLQQVHYWITMPKAHERDGRFWVYNSLPEWQEQFPFWSEDTIQRTIAHLEKQGVLLSGNYNEKSFDRTKWYTIDYEALDALEVTPPSRKIKRPSRESASPSPQLAVTITADSGEHDRNLRRPIPETNTETNNRESTPAQATRDISPEAPEPAGRYIKLRKDLPPIKPVPKPSDDPTITALLDELRPIYPFRDGKCARPALAKRALASLTPAERAQVKMAAGNYAASRDGLEGYAQDLHTWIEGEAWREYLTPATPRPLRLVSNGSPVPAPAPALPRLDRAYLQAQKGR